MALLLAGVLWATGCGRDKSQLDADKEAIRAAVLKYLNERGTINVAAMDVSIEDLKIAGDRADAQVHFRTKGGEGEMRMAYVLLRQRGEWVVQPPPRSETGTPHPGIAQPQGGGDLPAGHPPITPQGQSTTPSPPAKKP